MKNKHFTQQVEILAEIVEEEFGINREELFFAKHKTHEISEIRRILFVILKRHSYASNREIGSLISNRNHSTVTCSVKKHYQIMSSLTRKELFSRPEYAEKFQIIYQKFLDKFTQMNTDFDKRINHLESSSKLIDAQIEFLNQRKKLIDTQIDECIFKNPRI